jgi:hypothetical protein
MLGKSTDRKDASELRRWQEVYRNPNYRDEVMRASTVLRGERLLAFTIRSAQHAVQGESPLDPPLLSRRASAACYSVSSPTRGTRC